VQKQKEKQMKKIMIIAAVAISAAFANAASVDWLGSYVMQPGASSVASGYLGALFAADDISIADLSAQIAVGDFTGFNTFGVNQKTTNASGSFAATSWGTMDAGEHTFYAVVIDASTVADATQFWVSGTKTEALVDGVGMETTVNFGLMTDTMTASNWTAITSESGESGAVPEPTSGLLMLLGVAGLALRRKQA
jgi:hypothetical protein